jgi:hypothetical protein
VNGNTLALGVVGALALAGAVGRRGSATRTAPVKTVPVERFWTIPNKLEETLTDIAEGRRSYSYDAPLRVSALDTPRGHYFVLDGHHRLVERIQAGDRTVEVELDAHLPRIERTGGGYRDMVAQKVNIAARVRRGSARRGGANTDREIFVTTTTGDEVFGHVTTRAGAEAIQRQGFRVGEGKYGTGVYLLSPEEEWGEWLPPAATPAHDFQLRWHEGRDDLRVLRVSLPAGTRLLRVTAPPGDATLQAMKVLHGDAAGTERYRAAWKRDREEATLHEDLRAAGIDGVYWVDPVWNADEILVLDPTLLTVVREQIQKGSRAKHDLGTRLHTVLRENDAFRILDRDPELNGTDWGQGGCAVLASALHALLPGSEVWAVFHSGSPSHYLVRYEDRFYDGDGASTDKEFWKRWEEEYPEQSRRMGARLVAVQDIPERDETTEILCPADIVRVLVAYLRPRLFPKGSRAREVRRTDPTLWERVKAEVTASDKGGRPGQWSARKAQRAVQLYKKRGGGYLGPKDPDNALARWTRQDWRTYSGAESLETGERYLPAEAFDLLTPAEIGATTRAKREGMRKGKQFVAQPPKIAAKVKPTRQ